MELAIVDADDARREELRARWLDHLEALPEVEADEAERRVLVFARYAGPFMRPDEEDE